MVFYMFEANDYYAMIEKNGDLVERFNEMPWAIEDSQDAARDSAIDWLSSIRQKHGEGCVILNEQGEIVERITLFFGDFVDPHKLWTDTDSYRQILNCMNPPQDRSPKNIEAVTSYVEILRNKITELE